MSSLWDHNVSHPSLLASLPYLFYSELIVRTQSDEIQERLRIREAQLQSARERDDIDVTEIPLTAAASLSATGTGWVRGFSADAPSASAPVAPSDVPFAWGRPVKADGPMPIATGPYNEVLPCLLISNSCPEF